MMKTIPKVYKLVTIGWREWIELPVLGIPTVKAKIDTGARTSSLHAFKIKEKKTPQGDFVLFIVHPLQRKHYPEYKCTAKIWDKRYVTNSGGQKELRYVIKTPIKLGDHIFETEITLTNRDAMSYRMLLGRQSLSKKFLIDTSKSYIQGRKKNSEYDTYAHVQNSTGQNGLYNTH